MDGKMLKLIEDISELLSSQNNITEVIMKGNKTNIIISKPEEQEKEVIKSNVIFKSYDTSEKI